MAQQDLGRVVIIPRGMYLPTITYEELDAVTYDGATYLCRAQCRGVEPTNDMFWMQLVRPLRYEHLTDEQKQDIARTANEQVTEIREQIAEMQMLDSTDPALVSKIADLYALVATLEEKHIDLQLHVNTCDRVVRLSESQFEAVQEQIEYESRFYPLRIPSFIEKYLGWSIDVMEDGYTPPPSPEGASTITPDGTLMLNGTITADGTLMLNGTISADGTLIL